MAQETLRLDIVANNKDAVAALKQTDAELKKVASSALQTGSNVAKGSNQAANALTNLGRVAQDAPFGFIGIQNNLNPLLESFQRLKAESGSTSGALKSLAGSLIGPAGLGLALSVGSALLITFGDKLTEASKETKMLDAAQKSLTDTLSKNLGQARAEAGQLQILSTIVKDTTQSTENRARALKQLKEEYPAYEALQKVDINDTAKLAEVTKTLSAAIMRKARVQAYSSLIAEEEAKQVKIALENDKQRADRLGFLSNAIKKYAVPLLGLIDPTNANIAATRLQGEAAEKTAEEYEFNAGILKTYNAELSKLTGEQIKNNDATILGGKAHKEKKQRVVELKDAVSQYIKELQYAYTVQQQGMRNVSDRGVLAGDYSNPQVEPSQGMIDRTLAVQKATQAQLGYANALRLTAINEEQAANITNVAMSAFTSLGNAMLQGQDIGEALSNTFKRLIVDLTAMVARALLFKAIMTALSGGTSMGFQTGAIIGKLLGGGLPFARDGGVFSGPQSGYPAILHGTEAVLNPKQFKNLTSNMMNFGAMRGMGQSQPSSGQVVLRGQDLVLALDRAGVNLNLRRG